MVDAAQRAALWIVLVSAYLRTALVLYGTVRTVAMRRRFAVFRVGWAEVLCAGEPPLLLVIAWRFQREVMVASPATGVGAVAAVLGAVLAVLAWSLYVWTFVSWPTLFVGHGVLADHALVTRGAYGFVRHPAYLSAFLVWASVGVAFRSWGVIALTALYVIPVYRLYIGSEEAMLAESFGEAYRDYRRAVPMLVPRRRPGRRE
jgi:protein-S-isoprenylcysteine O-methyltransferase Ste14